MKIHNINKIAEIYNTGTIKKTPSKDTKVQRKDELNISDEAKDFQLAFKKAKESPDIRHDRVEQIKQQMATGSYNVSAQEVADKMVSKFFDQYR